jgi:hypothetical protein
VVAEGEAVVFGPVVAIVDDEDVELADAAGVDGRELGLDVEPVAGFADRDGDAAGAGARGAEPADVLADGLPLEGVGAGVGRGCEAGAEVDAGAGGDGAGEVGAQAFEAAAVGVEPVVAEAVAGGRGPGGVAGVVEAEGDLEGLAGGERWERRGLIEGPGEAGVAGDDLDGDEEVAGEAGGAPPAPVLADRLELQIVAAGGWAGRGRWPRAGSADPGRGGRGAGCGRRPTRARCRRGCASGRRGDLASPRTR